MQRGICALARTRPVRRRLERVRLGSLAQQNARQVCEVNKLVWKDTETGVRSRRLPLDEMVVRALASYVPYGLPTAAGGYSFTMLTKVDTLWVEANVCPDARVGLVAAGVHNGLVAASRPIAPELFSRACDGM